MIDASSNKAAVGASWTRWWCLSASLLLAGHGGKEERETARCVLVLPLLDGRGGKEERLFCTFFAAVLRRGLCLPSYGREVRRCFLPLPGTMVVCPSGRRHRQADF
jgi:hypothetical protein